MVSLLNAQDMIPGKIAGVNVQLSDQVLLVMVHRFVSVVVLLLTRFNDPLIVIDGMPMDNNNTKGVNNPLVYGKP